ncbi:MAG TPA: septum formation initiator family protein [Turneriella sp.]|nr:septum formation initiator family protein [Turneriella sp.]HNA78245.1 septum formation initiator family protein [Turneriella sp.]HNE20787.1 septum formation initiator family protein [Turneriella sp.]HNJ64467.1 septum formation initiator family protein [Turneriella sp.]HNL10376.1 septum formation initiator family protein [Turneriella sp.]
MLTQRIGKIIERSREHWLFVPLFVLLILSFVYVFFIGDKGLMAYRVRMREKEDLKTQIESLTRQKAELRQKLAMLRNKEMAVQKFSKDFYLFQEKVRILKFRESAEEKPAEQNESADLGTLQKSYIIISTLVIALVTLFFYRRNAAQMNLDRVRPFALSDGE